MLQSLRKDTATRTCTYLIMKRWLNGKFSWAKNNYFLVSFYPESPEKYKDKKNSKVFLPDNYRLKKQSLCPLTVMTSSNCIFDFLRDAKPKRRERSLEITIEIQEFRISVFFCFYQLNKISKSFSVFSVFKSLNLDLLPWMPISFHFPCIYRFYLAKISSADCLERIGDKFSVDICVVFIHTSVSDSVKL